VKGGLVSRLDRVLQMETSRRNLANHQLFLQEEEEAAAGKADKTRPRPGLHLQILGVHLIGCVISLRGRDNTEGKEWRLMICDELCPRLPTVGEVVTVAPPWTLLPGGETQLIVGVTALSLENASEHRRIVC
jgi:hypothetical protein